MDEKISPAMSDHHDEVETATILKGATLASSHACHGPECAHDHHQPSSESSKPVSQVLSPEELEAALNAVSKDVIWRVKGFITLTTGHHILNWAFGRYDLTPTTAPKAEHIKLTVMGERDEVKRASRKLAQALGGEVV
jgi:G3E family GTPase